MSTGALAERLFLFASRQHGSFMSGTESAAQNKTISDEWGDFTAIPNDFIRQAQVLSDQSRWLFVLLRHYTNGETKTAFPSYDLIQLLTGWARGTISKAIKDLEKAGWLTKHKGFGSNSHYTLQRQQTPIVQSVNYCEPEQFTDKTTEFTGRTIDAPNSSQGELQKFTEETSIVHGLNSSKIESTKTEYNKTEIKKAASAAPSQPRTAQPVRKSSKPKTPKPVPSVKPKAERAPNPADPYFESFKTRFEQTYAAPYAPRNGKLDGDYAQMNNLLKLCESKHWPMTDWKFAQALDHYFATPQGAHTLADLAARFSTFFRAALDKYGKPVDAPANGNGALVPTSQMIIDPNTLSSKTRQNAYVLEQFVNGGRPQ